MNKYFCSSCETHLFPGNYFEAIFLGRITEKEGNKTKYCIENIEFIFCENCGCNILRRWLKDNPDSIRKIFGLNDEIVGQARFELFFLGEPKFLEPTITMTKNEGLAFIMAVRDICRSTF